MYRSGERSVRRGSKAANEGLPTPNLHSGRTLKRHGQSLKGPIRIEPLNRDCLSGVTRRSARDVMHLSRSRVRIETVANYGRPVRTWPNSDWIFSLVDIAGSTKFVDARDTRNETKRPCKRVDRATIRDDVSARL
jgi:hypothetical protein